MADETALYRLFNASDELLYIGISEDLDRRFARHKRRKPWWAEVARSEVTWYATRRDARQQELHAIRTQSPMYNIRHNDGRPSVAQPATQVAASPEGGIQLNVLIPRELKQRLKHLALDQGRTLSDLVTEAFQAQAAQ